jgi:signal transduction histidine kinase
MVRNSGRHLLDLINDILDISKIEAGELEVQAKPFDPEESIRRVAGLMRPTAESKGLAFTVETTRLPGVVVGDRRRVEQVLLNLISNAVKFTEAGEVTVTVDTVPTPGAGEALRMRVGDTGIGIRNEDLATLFQPFRQVDAGPSRQFEGTGLGLAICRRLSDLMGGTISVASEWGRGSTFTFSLPTTPTPAAGDEPPSAPHRGQ